MSNPFIGEIRMFGGNFPPSGWAFCDGQLMQISENDALFALIGTIYGGDGRNTFALPDLRGRVPIHSGAGFTVGQLRGTESVTLSLQEMPIHQHPSASTATATLGDSYGGKVLGKTDPTLIYGSGTPNVSLDSSAMVAAGGSQPHNNLMPYQCVSFIISLFGIFPSRN